MSSEMRSSMKWAVKLTIPQMRPQVFQRVKWEVKWAVKLTSSDWKTRLWQGFTVYQPEGTNPCAGRHKKGFLICRTHKILCVLQMRNPFLCRPAHGFVPSGWYTVKPCQSRVFQSELVSFTAHFTSHFTLWKTWGLIWGIVSFTAHFMELLISLLISYTMRSFQMRPIWDQNLLHVLLSFQILDPWTCWKPCSYQPCSTVPFSVSPTLAVCSMCQHLFYFYS